MSRQMSKGKMPHLRMLREREDAVSEVTAGLESDIAVGDTNMETTLGEDDAVAYHSPSEDEDFNFRAQKSRISRQLRKGSVPLQGSTAPLQPLSGSLLQTHKSMRLQRAALNAAELEALAASSGDERLQPSGRVPVAKPPAHTEVVESDDENDALEALIRQQKAEISTRQEEVKSAVNQRRGDTAVPSCNGKLLTPAAAMANLWEAARRIEAKVEEHARRAAELSGRREEAERMLAKLEEEEKQLLAVLNSRMKDNAEE
eukprot:3709298-Amphidinium_carterae.1